MDAEIKANNIDIKKIIWLTMILLCVVSLIVTNLILIICNIQTRQYIKEIETRKSLVNDMIKWSSSTDDVVLSTENIDEILFYYDIMHSSKIIDIDYQAVFYDKIKKIPLAETRMLKELSEINWAEKLPILKHIHNQGPCGSCWVFAAAGQIEAFYAINNPGKETAISSQHLLDCTTSYSGMGGSCVMGNFGAAILGASTHKIDILSNYPYTNKQSTCQSSVDGIKWFNDFDIYFDNSFLDLYFLLSKQPFATSLEIGNHTPFIFYSRGIIFMPLCRGETDHQVLVTGFGIENGMRHWIIKNSWGPNWGENGFARIAIDNNLKSCGFYNAVAKLY